VNVTARGASWADFEGFADVFDTGGPQSPPVALTDRRFLVAFATPAGESRSFGLTYSSVDSVCAATETCPLYPAVYAHQTTRVAAGKTATFVTALVPHGPSDAPAPIAESLRAVTDGAKVNISLALPSGAVVAVLELVSGEGGPPTKWEVKRQR
jgi:hypothetical protein